MLESKKNNFQKGKTMKHTTAKVSADMLSKSAKKSLYRKTI